MSRCLAGDKDDNKHRVSYDVGTRVMTKWGLSRTCDWAEMNRSVLSLDLDEPRLL